jgi:hypothetical protein
VFCLNKNIDTAKIRQKAADYYRNGDFFCSEAIVKAIKDEFDLPLSDDVIAMASGFPVGMGGSGCTAGQWQEESWRSGCFSAGQGQRTQK